MPLVTGQFSYVISDSLQLRAHQTDSVTIEMMVTEVTHLIIFCAQHLLVENTFPM